MQSLHRGEGRESFFQQHDKRRAAFNDQLTANMTSRETKKTTPAPFFWVKRTMPPSASDLVPTSVSVAVLAAARWIQVRVGQRFSLTTHGYQTVDLGSLIDWMVFQVLQRVVILFAKLLTIGCNPRFSSKAEAVFSEL